MENSATKALKGLPNRGGSSQNINTPPGQIHKGDSSPITRSQEVGGSRAGTPELVSAKEPA